MKNKRIKNVFGIFLIIGVVVLFFFMINNRPASKEQSGEQEVNKLINYNLTVDYPQSPREVVTLYSRLVKCLYSEKYTTDQYALLLDQLRGLYDQELLDKNPYSEHYDNVLIDIANYKSENKVISSYIVSKADDTDYQTLSDGSLYALINAKYNMTSDKGKEEVKQRFTLRRDKEGHWKILYWKKIKQ